MKITIRMETLSNYSEALVAAHSIVCAAIERRPPYFDDVFRYCETVKSIIDDLGEVSDFEDIGDFLRVVGEELVATENWGKVLAEIGSATDPPDMTIPKDGARRSHKSRAGGKKE